MNKSVLIMCSVMCVMAILTQQMVETKPLDIYDDIMEEDKLFLRMAELIDSIGGGGGAGGSDDDDEDIVVVRQSQQNEPTVAPTEIASALNVRCTLPVRKGVCRALIPRWSYDPVSKECKEFKFGGCDGNGNNFSSQKQCFDTCKGQ